jgi:hypothetical protein
MKDISLPVMDDREMVFRVWFQRPDGEIGDCQILREVEFLDRAIATAFSSAPG